MERLTIKEEGIRNNFNAEYAKLADLEDIEQELGIDLITLFKAVKQGYIYIKGCLEDKNRICKVSARLSQGWNTLCWSIPQTKEVKMYCYGNARYFKGYGKTWALTREELE